MPATTCCSPTPARLASRPRRGRGSTSCATASRPRSPTPSRRSSCWSRTPRAARLSELYELAGDLERDERSNGVHVRARIPARSCTASPSSRSTPRPERDVELRFQRLSEAARLPTRAHDGDAGLDLYASEAATLAPGGGRTDVGTGIAVEIPPGHAGLVLPRSGSARKHGITLTNAPGLIDAGYRGELRVLMLNTDPPRPFEIVARRPHRPARDRRRRGSRAGGGRRARRQRARRGRLRVFRALTFTRADAVASSALLSRPLHVLSG